MDMTNMKYQWRQEYIIKLDIYEFDIIAHNGNEVIVVEIKTTMKVKDLNSHY